MNELQLIGQKITALNEADLRIQEMEIAGQITLSERDAWLEENQQKRDRLARRREKLNETQGGTTPVLTPTQAQNLRAAVARLQAQNLGEAAVRALLAEVLTVAEALSASDEVASDAVSPEWSGTMAGAAASALQPSTILLFLGGVAAGLLLATLSTRRE